ncbi:MAG: 50S ribosomal protein L25/general stress protein Ctc [Magnetococcales bacterium]|nr:50S ribosomal protein L25/general stress protein Ctc [Magnetococcales bacterium]
MAIIHAESRSGTGKGVARRLRRQGRIPAVLYGGGQGNVNLSLDLRSWVQLVNKLRDDLRTDQHELIIDGQAGSAVLVRGIERDPVTWIPLHVDFLRFDPNSEVDAEVPVHVVDEEKSAGVKRGGAVHLICHSLAVRCRAGNIPRGIEISVAHLDIGDSVHVNDVRLPEGVELHSDTNFAVVTVAGVQGEAVQDSGAAGA